MDTGKSVSHTGDTQQLSTCDPFGLGISPSKGLFEQLAKQVDLRLCKPLEGKRNLANTLLEEPRTDLSQCGTVRIVYNLQGFIDGFVYILAILTRQIKGSNQGDLTVSTFGVLEYPTQCVFDLGSFAGVVLHLYAAGFSNFIPG